MDLTDKEPPDKVTMMNYEETFGQGEDWENFGDALVPFLVKRITNSKIIWKSINAKDSQKIYVVIGSVLELANKNNIVWGAGIIKSNAKTLFLSLCACRISLNDLLLVIKYLSI